MPSLKPLFLGYLAKKVIPCPEWLDVSEVEWIYSVCDCFSKEAPKDYSKTGWTWNRSGFYNAESLAREAIPAGEFDEYTLFAYRIYPVEFDETGMNPIDPGQWFPDLPEEARLDAYDVVGFDLVEGVKYGMEDGRIKAYSVEFDFQYGMSFSCSPLSCNHMASEYPVNQYCLIDDFNQALDIGKYFGSGKSGVEPPPYYLFQVLCKKPL